MKLGVDVRVSTKVTAADEHGLQLGDEHLPSELMVWAAGIKAPDFLKDLAGLENNRINQLLVLPTLQTRAPAPEPKEYVDGPYV